MHRATLSIIIVAALISVSSQTSAARQHDRFKHNGNIDFEAEAPPADGDASTTEAETGFDNQTNGYLEQGPEFDTLTDDSVEALRSFNDNRFIFEEVESISDGLGLIYNAQSCRECHQNVVTGGASQIPVQRVGRQDGPQFFESLGNKRFHPYSDYLLHDVGTGDGIPVQSTPEYAFTANLIRTAPLWGLRTRSRLMHDGLSFTREDAIRRHSGQARSITRQYEALADDQQALLNAFLDSL